MSINDEFSSGGIPPEDAAADLLSSATPAAPQSGGRSQEFQHGSNSGMPGMPESPLGGGAGAAEGAGAEAGGLGSISELAFLAI